MLVADLGYGAELLACCYCGGVWTRQKKRGRKPSACSSCREHECEHCGQGFERHPDDTGTRVRFCSKRCQGKAERKTGLEVCSGCGKRFWPRRVDRTEYCSRECYFRSVHLNAVQRRKINEVNERKLRVARRDNWRCRICGGSISRDVAWPHPMSLSIDHVHPKSLGGSDHINNLRATHWKCNRDRRTGEVQQVAIGV